MCRAEVPRSLVDSRWHQCFGRTRMAIGSSETSEPMYSYRRRHGILHNRCAMRTSCFRPLNWKYQLRLLNSFRGRPFSMIILWVRGGVCVCVCVCVFVCVCVCVCVHVASTCTCAVPHEAHDSHGMNPTVRPWGVHVQTTSTIVDGAGRCGVGDDSLERVL
jgi:hypothetical protein